VTKKISTHKLSKRKTKDTATKALLTSVMPTQIDDGCEIIQQLKEKFHSNIDRSQQVMMLKKNSKKKLECTKSTRRIYYMEHKA